MSTPKLTTEEYDDIFLAGADTLRKMLIENYESQRSELNERFNYITENGWYQSESFFETNARLQLINSLIDDLESIELNKKQFPPLPPTNNGG